MTMTPIAEPPVLQRPDIPLNLLPQLIKINALLLIGTYTPEQMADTSNLSLNQVRKTIKWLRALGAKVEGDRSCPWRYSEPFDLKSLVDAELAELYSWQPE